MKRLPLYESPPEAAIERTSPIDRDPGCTKCALAQGVQTPCMGAEGEAGGLLVIGDSPLVRDDKAGRPFTGPGGTLLRNTVGLHWQGPVAYTNAVLCAPNKRKMTDRYITQCRGYLAAVVRDVKPTRILVLGSQAAFGLLGRNVSVTSARGGHTYLYQANDSLFESAGPIPVFYSIGPTTASRNRFLRDWFTADLERALRGPLPPQPPLDGEVRVVETEDDAEEAVEDLMSAKWAAWDVETAGAMHDPSFRLLCLSAAPAGSTYAWVWGSTAFADAGARKRLIDWLEDPRAPKIGANVKYDIRAVKLALGAKVKGIVGDARLWRKLLSSDASGYLDDMMELVGMGGAKAEAQGAKAAAVGPLVMGVGAEEMLAKRATMPDKRWPALHPVRQAGLDALRAMDAKDPGLAAYIRDNTAADDAESWAYAVVPEDILFRYNARDSVGANYVAQWADERVKEHPGLVRIREALVNKVASRLARVEEWGIGFSVKAATEFDEVLEEDAAVERAIIDKHPFCGPDFNVNSPVQIRSLLFEKMGFESIKLTDTGLESTEASVLKHFEKRDPVLGAICNNRHINHIRSTYGMALMKVLRADGRIHPSILPDGAQTGRTSMANPNCFDGRTEVLVHGRGWVRFDELVEGERVAQWDDGVITFVTPTAYFRAEQRPTVRITTDKQVDLLVTPDHRCLLRNRKTNELRVFPAHAYQSDWQQIHAGVWGGGSRDFGALLQLVVAAQADAEVTENRLTFSFRKPRKIDRLRAILRAVGVTAEESPRAGDQTQLTVRGPIVKSVTDLIGVGEHKAFGPWVLELTRAQLDLFCEEVFHWDGCFTRMNHYSSSVRPNVDWVQTALALSGKRARIREYMPPSGRVNYQVDVTHRDYSLTTNCTVENGPVQDVYCVSVPSSYLMVRRNGKIAITGNCQNQPSPKRDPRYGKLARDCFVTAPGRQFVSLDYSQIELRVAAMMSGDEVMIEAFLSGEDFHRRTAKLIAKLTWGIDPDDVDDIHRAVAKNINFACLYNAGAGRVSEMIQEQGMSCSRAEAQRAMDMIGGQFKQFSAWRDARIDEVKRLARVNTSWEGQPARIRHLIKAGDPDEYVRQNAINGGVNMPVQGTASDYLMASLCEAVDWIESKGFDEAIKLCIPIHDQLLFDVEDQYVDLTINTVREIMMGWPPVGPPVPLLVDAETGTAWGSLSKVKK